MKTFAYHSNNIEDLKESINTKIEEGFNPNLAICFSDVALDFKAISRFLTELSISTIGTTTCGEICNDESLDQSCSILMFEMNPDHFDIVIKPFKVNEFETAKSVAEAAKTKFKNPAMITYASKIGVNGDLLVAGFKEVLEKQAPVFGGLAGDNFRNEEFTVFSNDQFEKDGLVALILDGDMIKVEGESFSGWQELGKTHIVTKAEGNVLYEIDHLPALELFRHYFGVESSNTEDGKPVVQIPGMYPLKVINDDDTGYMRSPLFYNNEHQSLTLAGEVEVGKKFKFCPMPVIGAVENTINHFRQYHEKNPNIDAVLINSCAGRKMAFGMLMEQEIKDIYEFWKVPTAGFMAMGEIGNYTKDDECEFHNVTCSLVSLTEI